MKHRFAEMIWNEIKDASDQDRVAVLPVATYEDHGPHLPVDVDVLLCSEYGTWAHQTWDLTPWVGSTIRLRAGFNSWDQDANTGKGIALDEFRFERGCTEF